MSYRKYPVGTLCIEPDCTSAVHAKSLCVLHYQRLRIAQIGTRWKRQTGRKCIAPNCDKWAISRELCGSHYTRWRAGKGLVIKPRQTTCSEPECARKFHARGMCKLHYYRLYRQDNRDRRAMKVA